MDELQAWVEEQLPWLKEDISSSETSDTRTPSPDIELGDLAESEEAARNNLVLELQYEVFRFRDLEPVCLDEINKPEEASLGLLLNESFRFREPEQLTEVCRFQEAAQSNVRPEQEAEGTSQEKLRVAYRKYIQTRQRIVILEEQLRTYDFLWFVVLPESFWEPKTGVTGALEELKMQIDGRRAAVLHAAEVWAAAEPKEADSPIYNKTL